MGRYSDRNLIKYEETIQLHFNTKGTIAWLTIKNYGSVFHQFKFATADRWEDVFEFLIGAPAGVGDRMPQTIDIGAMLDAPAVIKLQCAMINVSKWFLGKDVDPTIDVDFLGVLQPTDVLKRITDALGSIGFPGADFNWDTFVKLIGRPSVRRPAPAAGPKRGTPEELLHISQLGLMSIVLSGHPGTPIQELIAEARSQANALTAYFPDPQFIIEEQRTALKLATTTGKTKNADSRDIRPIRVNEWDPPPPSSKKEAPFSYQEFLDQLDKDREKAEKAFRKGKTKEDQFLKGREWLNRENFPKGAKYLHRHLPRIMCYGFRGDERGPRQMAKGMGFLPGVTRLDKEVESGKKIDAALKANDGGKSYLEEMKKLDVLTLGMYTAKADLKGFVSASTSTAIAKHFANAYAPEDNPYKPFCCYALRCKGAFHLPTHATQGWVAQRHAEVALVHNAEQEVVVAGGVGWGDVVGMRVIRVDQTGQYFHGPVFMTDLLRKEYHATLPPKRKYIEKGTEKEIDVWRYPPDDDAFDRLFQLFSGRSQGVGVDICWSYDKPPFDCPPNLMAARDAIEELRQRMQL